MLGSSSSTKPSPSGREALLGNTPTEAPGVMPMPLDPGARGLSSLQQTQQIAADTEALGLGILDQLGHQRNQLTSAVQTREEAHRTLSTSNRLIRQMHRRATWMKCALCSIVMLLVGGIGVIVYMHWFAGGDPPAPAPPAGRMLQGEVPSPPPAIVATPQPGVGAGIILLLCVGLFGVLLTFLAIPRGIVARTGAFCVSFFLFLLTVLILFLMPRAPPPSVAPPSDERLVDISTIGRIFLASCASAFALCGCVGVMVHHVMAAQNAPRVIEPEPIELYRDVKVVA